MKNQVQVRLSNPPTLKELVNDAARTDTLVWSFFSYRMGVLEPGSLMAYVMPEP